MKTAYAYDLPQDTQRVVQAFRVHLASLGYQPGSQQMLPACVREFLIYTGSMNLTEITAGHIQDYHQHLQTRPNQRRGGGLSEVMISHHIYALRVFFSYLLDSGLIQENPISGLSFPRPTSQARPILSQAEVKQLFAACHTLREKALLHLFYSCGLRRNEAVMLDLKDIHYRSGLLYVREGKGARRRVVPLTATVGSELKAYYLEERGQYVNLSLVTEAFLLNKAGKRMSGNQCDTLLKALLKRAFPPSGETGKRAISLHSLRHSIATHLLENGLPVESVRDFLGHRHLESTQVYTRISEAQLQNL